MWSFPDGLSIPDRMRRAKVLGYEGIELCLSYAGGEFSLDTPDSGVRALKQAADDNGIAISGVCSGLFFQFSLTSAREEIRRGAMTLIRRMIECAELLGCDHILAVPGMVGADFRPEEVVPDVSELLYYAGAEVVPYDVAYDRAQHAFRELAPFAQAHGVRIGMENIWGKFLISPLEMRDFIDAIGSDSVGAYFDVGNCVLFGYPEQWIRILGGRIVCVHLKDFKRGTTQLSGFCDLLSGDVDWPAVTDALKEIGYCGWANAEMTPVYRSYPEHTAAAASAAIDMILGRRGAAEEAP